jgi:hypothetical protein
MPDYPPSIGCRGPAAATWTGIGAREVLRETPTLRSAFIQGTGRTMRISKPAPHLVRPRAKFAARPDPLEARDHAVESHICAISDQPSFGSIRSLASLLRCHLAIRQSHVVHLPICFAYCHCLLLFFCVRTIAALHFELFPDLLSGGMGEGFKPSCFSFAVIESSASRVSRFRCNSPLFFSARKLSLDHRRPPPPNPSSPSTVEPVTRTPIRRLR